MKRKIRNKPKDKEAMRKRKKANKSKPSSGRTYGMVILMLFGLFSCNVEPTTCECSVTVTVPNANGTVRHFHEDTINVDDCSEWSRNTAKELYPDHTEWDSYEFCH